MYKKEKITGRDIMMFREDLVDEFGHDMCSTYLPLVLLEMNYVSLGEALVDHKEDEVRETLRSRVLKHRELFRKVN